MQYCAAPRLEAACLILFSLKKCCTTCRPRPSPPNTALAGTRTSRNLMCAWSVGMLNVQRYSSTVKPMELTGVRNAVIPSASPGRPLVLAKIRSCVAACTPVFQVFSPLITHWPPSRTAVVSMNVASEPCAGSVMPNAKPFCPAARPSVHSARCSVVP